MNSSTGITGFPRAAALVAMQVVLAGCSLLPAFQPPAGEPPPVAGPQLPPSPEPAPQQSPAPTQAPRPEPVPVAPPRPVPPPRVAVVLSSRAEAYEGVSTELAGLLEDVETYDLSDKSMTQKEAHDTILASGAAAVVAIGMRAAVFAASFEALPVVYAQVFNAGELTSESPNFRGVSAIPPLDLQLDAWRALNPQLTNVGAILGDGHEPLLAEATRATEERGMHLHYRLAQSDREALYLFTRLVPEIDGFWLFPDNRILSSEVLKEMLAFASRHRVQVAVFNDSLLALGATLSTTSDNRDIAEAIVSVVRGLLAGPADAVPQLTPLSRITVRTNGRAATAVAAGAIRNTGGER